MQLLEQVMGRRIHVSEAKGRQVQLSWAFQKGQLDLGRQTFAPLTRVAGC